MRTIELFKLFGSILVDNEKANASIGKTEEKAQGLASKLGNGIKTAAKWGAAIGAGAAAAGGAMLKIATKTAETTDRIDKLSQKIGISREGFQEWEFILSQSGASIEGLQTGLKTMNLSVEQAAKGTGKGAEAFKQLGISVTDSTGKMKNQEEIFNESVVALQNMEDGTQKAILANQLFGRSGSELMPLLNGAAGSVEGMRKQARDLGLVLSNESIDAGVKFTDSLDQIKRSLSVVGTQVGAALLPMFQKLFDWVIRNLPEIKAFFSTAFDAISFVVGNVWKLFSNSLLPILKALYNWVRPYIPAMARVIEGAFDAIGYAIRLVFAPIEKAINLFNRARDAARELFSVTKDRPIYDDFTGEAINGSHANGLASVPFDGYVAKLHKNERVLTAEENEQYSNGIGGATNNFNISSLTVREEADINKIARALYDLQQKSNRGRGIVIG